MAAMQAAAVEDIHTPAHPAHGPEADLELGMVVDMPVTAAVVRLILAPAVADLGVLLADMGTAVPAAAGRL